MGSANRPKFDIEVSYMSASTNLLVKVYKILKLKFFSLF